MGGGASIDQAKTVHLDYSTLKAPGVDFFSAYNALQEKLKKTSSEHHLGDQNVSLQFLAVRQLSQNLKNQDSLERTKIKVLKQSRSLPYNLRYKQDDLDQREAYGSYHGGAEELDHTDLQLIKDSEYNILSPPKPNAFAAIPEGTSPVDSPVIKQDKKVVKKKPDLFLSVGESESTGAADAKQNELSGKEDVKSAQPKFNAPGGVDSNETRISPHGTLYMGKWKIMESGIVQQPLAPVPQHQASFTFENIKRNYIQDHGYFQASSNQLDDLAADGKDDGDTKRRVSKWKLSRDAETGAIVDPSYYSKVNPSEVALPALGKKDFIEIATLGSGASGVVSEAIHVPSLTIVALKMLPIYNHEKRLQVARELGVLYKNLTDMRLIDDTLGGLNGDDCTTNSDGDVSSSKVDEKFQKQDQILSVTSSNSRCPNVLSLYNAFIDPKSGMINLVIEYMDGGSLDDLVKQGGCKDERILADIAFQTLNGLAYLHTNKNVHRDIKPANVLCSSSGLIKIADFGISRALDKTSGFANSFVGTVCYMSPERITAESYSFPCDIWSFGLTLLAVSKGRFPLDLGRGKKQINIGDLMHSDEEIDPNSDSPRGQAQAVGGPGGYWAMIQAICDDPAPLPGKSFSRSFNEFISACLQKNPNDRLSAKQLLETDFIRENQDFIAAKQLLRVGSKEDGPGGSINSATPRDDSTLIEHSTFPDPFKSPLTAKLTTTTIARKSSTDFSNVANGKRFTEDLLGNKLMDSSINAEEDDENAIVYAIRMEHLGRTLEKIATKIKLSMGIDNNEFNNSNGSSRKSPGNRQRRRSSGNVSQQSFLYNSATNSSTLLTPTHLNTNTDSSIGSFDDFLIKKMEPPPVLHSPAEAKDATYHSILKHHATDEEVADEKKIDLNNTNTNNARSVHFDDVHESNGNKKTKRPNLKLEVEDAIIEDDGDEANGENNTNITSKLPKTSSYFIASKQQPSADTAHSSGSNSTEISPVVPKSEKMADYERMLPKLDTKGFPKWAHLAQQLHLPLPIVLIAARAHLGNIIDLDASEDPSAGDAV